MAVIVKKEKKIFKNVHEADQSRIGQRNLISNIRESVTFFVFIYVQYLYPVNYIGNNKVFIPSLPHMVENNRFVII